MFLTLWPNRGRSQLLNQLRCQRLSRFRSRLPQTGWSWRPEQVNIAVGAMLRLQLQQGS